FYCTLAASSLYCYDHLPRLVIFRSILRPPPASTLFPYTTLFRSSGDHRARAAGRVAAQPRTGGGRCAGAARVRDRPHRRRSRTRDRKSTRLNSSHVKISYAVFCLKKKKKRLHRDVDMKRRSAL